MERLEPVLKQKFWILLGVAILMTFVGWWMATAAIAKTIAERTTAIDASFKSIPSGEIPNETWAKKLGAINTEQANSIQVTQLAIWKRQRDRMTWPEGVIDPGLEGKFSNDSRQNFRDSYQDEVIRVWKQVNPMNEDDGTGIVKYPVGKVFALLKQRPWDKAPPTTEVMRTVREDLWLLEGLFQSITAANGGFDVRRGDATIHQIDKLELRGGDGKPKDSASASGDGGGGYSGMMGSPMPGGPMGGSSMMGPPMGGGPGGPRTTPGSITAGLTFVSAEFDPADELGDDGSGASAGGGSVMPGMMSSMMPGGMPTGAASSDPAAGGPEIKRYIQTDAQLPYRQRGFYLSVKMDHTKIPLLLAELTSNEKTAWPVEIKRVQMSRLNEDDSAGGKSPGSSMLGGSGGGMREKMSGMMPGMRRPTGGAGPGSGGYPGAANPEEDLNPFAELSGSSKQSGASDVTVLKRADEAKAEFENALSDPVMAQVTICGVITIFNPVKEPEEKKPTVEAPVMPTTPAISDDAVESEPKNPPSDVSPTEADKQTMEPATDAAGFAEPGEMSAEQPLTGDSTEMIEASETPDSSEPKTENDNK